MSIQLSDRLKKILNKKLWYYLTSSYRELSMHYEELKEAVLEQDELKSRRILHKMVGVCHMMEFNVIIKILFTIQEQIYDPDGVIGVPSLLPILELELNRLGEFIKQNRDKIEISIVGEEDDFSEELAQLLSATPKNEITLAGKVDDPSEFVRKMLPDVLIITPSGMTKKVYEKLPQLRTWFFGTTLICPLRQTPATLDLDLDISGIQNILD